MLLIEHKSGSAKRHSAGKTGVLDDDFRVRAEFACVTVDSIHEAPDQVAPLGPRQGCIFLGKRHTRRMTDDKPLPIVAYKSEKILFLLVRHSPVAAGQQH